MQPHIAKTNDAPQGTHHYTTLRQSWDYSRKEFRRVSADAEKLRRQAKELAIEWAVVVARTKELRKMWKHHRQGLPIDHVAHDKPFVATAKRVPWRRLQMDEVDGPIKVWIAPGYEEV